MILADENINSKVIAAIKNLDIEVYSIAKSHRGIKDGRVIELSREPPRLILTEDKDFGEWVFAHNVRDISVILLRYRFPETDQIIQTLSDLLVKRKGELMGKFTVITTNKIRIRNLRSKHS